MNITTKNIEGLTWYCFEKGNFEYSVREYEYPNGSWLILTTDKRLSAPHNWTSKVKFPSEMKAKIWKEFFSFMSAEAVAA